MNKAFLLILLLLGCGHGAIAPPPQTSHEWTRPPLSVPEVQISATDRFFLSQVISDRDLINPFLVDEGKGIRRLVFLRTRPLQDPTGPVTIQAGELTWNSQTFVAFLAWEPPHLFDRPPHCSLLDWDPGKRLSYRCEAPTIEEKAKRRIRKSEFHFRIPEEDSDEYFFEKTCLVEKGIENCPPFEEIPPEGWECEPPLETDPIYEKIKISEFQLVQTCLGRLGSEGTAVFLLSQEHPDGSQSIRVGEFRSGQSHPDPLSPPHPVPYPLCQIRDWRPGSLIRYDCQDPSIKTRSTEIPLIDFQWDLGLNYLLVRQCRLFKESGKRRCERAQEVSDVPTP